MPPPAICTLCGGTSWRIQHYAMPGAECQRCGRWYIAPDALAGVRA